MKRLFLLVACAVAAGVGALRADGPLPYQNPALSAGERVDDLISRMTVEEKIDLLSGYNDFFLHPCERLGIPAFKMADGPLGVASWGLFGRATAYPSALSLASSWNRDLAARTGSAFAEDWRARGIHIMLAPGVNIYRASKGARNFEYFGEDPYLTSEMVAPFVEAVTEGGVMPVVKHFVGNDQEYDRYNVSTEADERTLREIYMLPFENLVRHGGVKALMSGYNLLNGVHCSENAWMDSVLRRDWGFDGMYMSDWGATHSTLDAARNGLDMEMGSNDFLIREHLLPLLASGEISEELIDEKVRHIYKPCIEMGFLDRPQRVDSLPVYSPRRNRAALEAAREGIILLANDGGILPLDPAKVRRIAVIGPTADPSFITDRVHGNSGIVYGGGGSSKVNPWYVRTDLDGITAAFPDAEVLYAVGVEPTLKRRAFETSEFVRADGSRGLDVTYFSNDSTGEVADRATVRRINNEWWGAPTTSGPVGERFRIEWTGAIEASRTDTLMLLADTQGACRVWVDGREVIDGSGSQSFFFGEARIPVEKGQKLDLRVEYRNRNSVPAEMRVGYIYASDLDFSEAEKIAREADAVICCIGMDGSVELEGRDRPFALPQGQDLLVERMLAANPRTAVVLHGGGAMDISRWADRAPAIIHALYPGMEGGTALGEIVAGAVNPSAKLPFTFERSWADSPAAGNYDETREERKVYYREGIFTGYRGYDRSGAEPLYPFGHGLSYTQFEYSGLSIDREGDAVTVSFDVTNTGRRPGAETAQVYVTDNESALPRPAKELKGFAKVYLAPGATERMSIVLGPEAFRYYDPSRHGWTVEPGTFTVRVGGSSASLPLTGTVKL